MRRRKGSIIRCWLVDIIFADSDMIGGRVNVRDDMTTNLWRIEHSSIADVTDILNVGL